MTLRVVQAGNGDRRDLVVVYHLAAAVDETIRRAVGPSVCVLNETCEPAKNNYTREGPGALSSWAALLSAALQVGAVEPRNSSELDFEKLITTSQKTGTIKADVVLMGHILHDWDLPTKKMLIRKAYDALPAGGAFVAYEAIIDDARSQNAFGLMMSLNMLIENQEGAEYTFADCQSWMREVGFQETSTAHLVGPESMVVGIK